MQIYGPFRVSAGQGLNPAQANQTPQRLQSVDPSGSKPSATPVDQLDLSQAASGANRLDLSSQVAGGGEIRVDRVADIRRQIADGNYDTPEKLDAALDRFLDQLA
tara:strand:- start:221138 stop:221452 length:315 start_codon:yes stop_codon:yes gene_type:complete